MQCQKNYIKVLVVNGKIKFFSIYLVNYQIHKRTNLHSKLIVESHKCHT